MPAPIDMTGQIFGRLTVQRLLPERRARERVWECQCLCGNVAAATGHEIRAGDTRSCGCLRRENTANRGKANMRHGAAVEGQETPEYRSWVEMRRRCTNPNFIGYEYYGGRGIRVCERWNDFAAFLTDMGPKPTPCHSIDRENNDGDYELGNCRWATPKEQANNRRNSRR